MHHHKLFYILFLSSAIALPALTQDVVAGSDSVSGSPLLVPPSTQSLSLPATSLTLTNNSNSQSAKEDERKSVIASALLSRSLASISAGLSAAGAPFEYSANGLSRTYYPSYVGVPVYPSSSTGSGRYSVPQGATALTRSDTVNNVPDSSTYSVSSSPSSSVLLGSSTAAGSGRALIGAEFQPTRNNSPAQQTSSSLGPSTVSLTQLGQSRAFMPRFDGYAGVSSSSSGAADPAEPEDPADIAGSSRVSGSLPLAPRFNNPVPLTGPGTAGLANVADRPSFGSVINPYSIPTVPANSLVGAFTGRSSAPVNNGNNAPPGAISYTGPASSYAEATGYGKEGYAQSSPNTAYGSVYNPKVGVTSYPSYYGATPKSYGLGSSFPATSFFPFYLYYPVEYGYDQGEQTVMPTGYIPLIGYKRRYGYRHGPFYGYGIYIDYPPYFGFGKVKDGFGSDPEADLMAATALDQGSGASAAQSVYASRGNANSQNPGSGSTYNSGNGSGSYSMSG